MARRFASALALGPLAAAAAHAIAYGNGHVMGGAYGGALCVLTLLASSSIAAVGLGACLTASANSGQRRALAAHVQKLLPSVPILCLSAGGWFWLAESIESAHSWAPGWWLAIAAASALVRYVAGRALRAAAVAALAIRANGFDVRSYRWARVAERSVVAISNVRVCRLFSRPPPAGSFS
ncbi:MAG TPA: hypothetical protein VGF86_00100 [Candidatus Tumulicola sp.]